MVAWNSAAEAYK